MEEHLQKIDEIVYQALQLDKDEREEFLQKECDDSPGVLSEVRSLLANEKYVDNFLESQDILNYVNLFDDATSSNNSLLNKSIKNYKIVREIGVGGMGAVYLAERTSGDFEQKVAVKILRSELNTEFLRKRFRDERNILATLEHPNLARLLDAGTTEDNIPF